MDIKRSSYVNPHARIRQLFSFIILRDAYAKTRALMKLRIV